MKAPRPLKGHRRTGHWLTDALYTIPREHETTITTVSREIFGDESRASKIATNYGHALADIDKFFRLFGYEIELVCIEPKRKRA
ncbi:MAG: hypothetical protein KF895_03130 [Parvibaculum sp.]|nr:hypothetical protein [Parvibaculum sp.]